MSIMSSGGGKLAGRKAFFERLHTSFDSGLPILVTIAMTSGGKARPLASSIGGFGVGLGLAISVELLTAGAAFAAGAFFPTISS